MKLVEITIHVLGGCIDLLASNYLY